MRSKTCSHRQSKRVGRSQLGAILLVTLFCVVPASAQGRNAVVRGDPSVLEIGPGQVATLTIVLADAQNAYGVDVRATFDPQLVEVVDADPAKDGIQMMLGTFPQPDFVARNVADNQAGSLRYAVTQVNPTEPANGSGVIFSVQFRAKASSGQAAFTLGPVEMADRTGQLLDVQVENGAIRIVPAGQAAATASTEPPQAAPEQSAVAPADDAAQAATPGAPAPAAAEKPVTPILLLAALALVAIIAVAAIVIARR